MEIEITCVGLEQYEAWAEEDDEVLIGVGRSPEEALGTLIMRNYDLFNIDEIRYLDSSGSSSEAGS